MTVSHFDVRRTPRGLHPVVVGQPNDHMTNWRGCNFKFLLLPGWKRHLVLEDTPRNRRVLLALVRSVSDARTQPFVADRSGSNYQDCDTIDHDCNKHRTNVRVPGVFQNGQMVGAKTIKDVCGLCYEFEDKCRRLAEAAQRRRSPVTLLALVRRAALARKMH